MDVFTLAVSAASPLTAVDEGAIEAEQRNRLTLYCKVHCHCCHWLCCGCVDPIWWLWTRLLVSRVPCRIEVGRRTTLIHTRVPCRAFLRRPALRCAQIAANGGRLDL